MEEDDLYELLGAEFGCSDKDLKKAYRATALQKHPDKNPDNPHAGDHFAKIVAAYELLSDPARKQEYDERHRRKLQAQKKLSEMSDARRKAKQDLELREQQARTSAKKAADAVQEKAMKQKIQDELERFRAELQQEQARAAQSAAELAETVTVEVSWTKDMPPPSLEELRNLVASYADVVQTIPTRGRAVRFRLSGWKDAQNVVNNLAESKLQVEVLSAPAKSKKFQLPPLPSNFEEFERQILEKMSNFGS